MSVRRRWLLPAARLILGTVPVPIDSRVLALRYDAAVSRVPSGARK